MTQRSMYQIKEEWEEIISRFPYLDERLKKLMGEMYYLGCMFFYSKLSDLGVRLQSGEVTVASVQLEIAMLQEELTEFAIKTLGEIK